MRATPRISYDLTIPADEDAALGQLLTQLRAGAQGDRWRMLTDLGNAVGSYHMTAAQLERLRIELALVLKRATSNVFTERAAREALGGQGVALLNVLNSIESIQGRSS